MVGGGQDGVMEEEGRPFVIAGERGLWDGNGCALVRNGLISLMDP